MNFSQRKVSCYISQPGFEKYCMRKVRTVLCFAVVWYRSVTSQLLREWTITPVLVMNIWNKGNFAYKNNWIGAKRNTPKPNKAHPNHEHIVWVSWEVGGYVILLGKQRCPFPPGHDIYIIIFPIADFYFALSMEPTRHQVICKNSISPHMTRSCRLGEIETPFLFYQFPFTSVTWGGDVDEGYWRFTLWREYKHAMGCLDLQWGAMQRQYNDMCWIGSFWATPYHQKTHTS